MITRKEIKKMSYECAFGTYLCEVPKGSWEKVLDKIDSGNVEIWEPFERYASDEVIDFIGTTAYGIETRMIEFLKKKGIEIKEG